MRSLYEGLNVIYIEVGAVRVPTLVSTDANYEIGFWEEGIKNI